MCGCFLSPKSPIVIPLISTVLSNIWGLKGRILIREEEAGIFVFQFKDKTVKNQVLNDGPWFFSRSMLVMVEYDDVGPLKAVDLNHMVVWVAVKGLRMAIRNEKALTLLENELGVFDCFDPTVLQRKDQIQKSWIVHDVHRKIWAKRENELSPEVIVLLKLWYENCHGICPACGFSSMKPKLVMRVWLQHRLI